MLNELIISRNSAAVAYHGELLVTALNMPILVSATFALGLTMADIFGMIFILAVFSVGIACREVLRSYAKPVPEDIRENPQHLHFNLRLTGNYYLK